MSRRRPPGTTRITSSPISQLWPTWTRLSILVPRRDHRVAEGGAVHRWCWRRSPRRPRCAPRPPAGSCGGRARRRRSRSRRRPAPRPEWTMTRLPMRTPVAHHHPGIEADVLAEHGPRAHEATAPPPGCAGRPRARRLHDREAAPPRRSGRSARPRPRRPARVRRRVPPAARDGRARSRAMRAVLRGIDLQERAGQAGHVAGRPGWPRRGWPPPARRYLRSVRKDTSSGPAVSSGATPGHHAAPRRPRADAPSASASRPSVNEAPSLTYFVAFLVSSS